MADVASMTQDRDWSTEEKLYMEAEIIKRMAPSLNLSPSPLVAIISNKLHQRKYKFSTVPVKRAARRFSQVTLIHSLLLAILHITCLFHVILESKMR